MNAKFGPISPDKLERLLEANKKMEDEMWVSIGRGHPQDLADEEMMKHGLMEDEMSDLVKRLRQMDRGWPTILSTAANRIEQLEHEAENSSAAWVAACDRIEQLGRENRELKMQALSDDAQYQMLAEELAVAKEGRDGFAAMLAAEKALADRLYKSPYDRDEEGSRATYRKARGL